MKSEKLVGETADTLAQLLYEFGKGNMSLYDYTQKRKKIIRDCVNGVQKDLMDKVNKSKSFLDNREWPNLVKEFDDILKG
jgi:hypothetical protein